MISLMGITVHSRKMHTQIANCMVTGLGTKDMKRNASNKIKVTTVFEGLAVVPMIFLQECRQNWKIYGQGRVM